MEAKMKDEKFQITVTLLTVDEFLAKYPRFSSLVSGEGKVLFDAIMQKEVFIETSVLANHGYPSVLGVADICEEIINLSEVIEADSFTKQFIGSVVCTLMEANGYKKTGTKKSVPHTLFTSGEFYKKNQNISRIDSVKMCGSVRLANMKSVDTTINTSWKSCQSI
jgi:hypothetical protein